MILSADVLLSCPHRLDLRNFHDIALLTLRSHRTRLFDHLRNRYVFVNLVEIRDTIDFKDTVRHGRYFLRYAQDRHGAQNDPVRPCVVADAGRPFISGEEFANE